MIRTYVTILGAVLTTLRSTWRDTRASQNGSVTLEQIALTAGLVALALGVIAAITVAVGKYTAKL